MSTSWIILGVIALIVIYLIFLYNRLVSLRQTVSQSWSDISVQLKQRHDLIPNLVETVKGYATHERGTLEAVVNDVEHLEERGVLGDVVGLDVEEGTLGVRAVLTPDLQLEVQHLAHL